MCLERANTFSSKTTTIQANLKQKTVLLSSTSSLPPANKSWVYNDNPIDTNISKYKLAEKDSLIISDLRSSDSGIYRMQYNYYECIFNDITNLTVSVAGKTFYTFLPLFTWIHNNSPHYRKNIDCEFCKSKDNLR